MIRKISMLAILIVSLFFIASCDKVFNLGKDTIPNDDLLNVNICDTVQVHMITKKSFHILTTGGSDYFFYDYAPSLFIGKSTDPKFGITSAEFMTELRQTSYPDWTVTTIDSVILDSMCLVLPLDTTDYFYSSVTVNTLNVSVYKLNDTLNHYMYSDQDPTDYYNSADLIGTGNVYEKIFSDTTYKDTVRTITTTRTLMVRLSDTYAQEMIDNSKDLFFSTTSYFQFRFFGLYVKTNSDNSGIYKIIIDNSINGLHSGLMFFYHKNPDVSKQKTFVLPITHSCGRVNLFSHDYSGTSFEQQLQDSTIELQNAYFQSMAGTFVKVTLQGLKNLSGFIVNKAELIIKADISDATSYTPNPTLWLFGLDDSANVFQQFQDFYNSSYTGAEISKDGVYTFNVTRIIQGVIDGTYNYDKYGIYITDLNSKSNFDRVVLLNGNNSTPSKLIITYTKID